MTVLTPSQLTSAIEHLETARRILVLAGEHKTIQRAARSEVDKALALVHRRSLPDSIQEALNSGDGSYKP